MRKKTNIVKLVITSFVIMTLNGCNSFLDVDPLDRVTSDILLSDEAGLKMILANIYNGIPVEDHAYLLGSNGFNIHSWDDGGNPTIHPSNFTDESISGAGEGAVAPINYNMWVSGRLNGWERNRQINVFFKTIETTRDNGIISEDTYNRLWSEAHFARAYLYFAMARRFGGLPIIDTLQDDDYIEGGSEAIKVPRSTELDTWKFILESCDKAIENLPVPADFNSWDGDPILRANKWTAYALKSRAALYAASIAKFGNRVSFPPSEAVSQKLVGIDASEANFFYQECIDASKQIIDNGGYSLYRPNPANPQEAAKNYQNLFMNPRQAAVENIFIKTYLSGETYGAQGHMYDQNYSPQQVGTGFQVSGRFSVTLDMVDIYEEYDNDGSGESAPIATRTDGNEGYSFDTNTPTAAEVTNIPFVKYDNPLEPFLNKDARLHASVILPGSTYKGVSIVIQGAMIHKNDAFTIYSQVSDTGKDGNTYFTFGAENRTQYSGFDGPMDHIGLANFTNTGFSIRKSLGEDKSFGGASSASTTPFIDFRLAEIYLNYAEAVMESGLGDANAAEGYINALRHRAGHKDNIPLTLENVLRERRVEMAFEGQRMWDLFRRREYHTLFNNYKRKALVPAIDLREDEPKYVFIRMNQYNDIKAGGHTFDVIQYYQGIPGINVNGLINNPGR